MSFLQDFFGAKIHSAGVDADGMVRLTDIEKHLSQKPLLVSCMAAQNEVGTLQPISELVTLVRKMNPKTLVHVDAAQAVGKIEFNVKSLDIDLAVVAAQKFHGPKGVAACYIKNGVKLVSLVDGVSHENGRRAGTENVSGIVGLGAACEIARIELETNKNRVEKLRDALFENLKSRIPGLKLNGHPTKRLPNTLNVSFPHVDTTTLLGELSEQLCASNGAACHWGKSDPSKVLLAMGVAPELASGAVRLSLSRFTTEDEILRAADLLCSAVSKLHK
jgi:cysteine desulfurase